MIVTSEAIVINAKKYGDTSKIVSLYTREDGRINLIAKSARSSKNKYGATLEPMTQIYATYYKKSGSGLHLLSNAELITQLKGLTNSLEQMTWGLAIIEALKFTQEENEQNNELFLLVTDSLNILNTDPNNPFSIFISFLIKLCQIAGFKADFGDVNLPVTSPEKCYFSLSEGCIKSTYSANIHNVHRISNVLLRILSKLSVTKPLESTKITINKENINEIITFFEKYISFHLERSINFRSYNLINS
jgi:DNA repair protein RecO (recombination protein O)